jgi:hypothetical protein
MSAGIDLPAGRALVASVEAIRGSCFAEQRPGQLRGEQPFTDAARPGEEIGMRKPAEAHHLRERPHLRVMSSDSLKGHA